MTFLFYIRGEQPNFCSLCRFLRFEAKNPKDCSHIKSACILCNQWIDLSECLDILGSPRDNHRLSCLRATEQIMAKSSIKFGINPFLLILN